MQIALIADLHGNRPAVEALEKDLAFIKPDKIFCLGDTVGKGPDSRFTFDWAEKNCDLILGGNWDYGVANKEYPKDIFYWDQLGEERLEKLRSLPLEHEMMMSGRRIRFFHGRPIMKKLVTVKWEETDIMPFFDDGNGGRYDVVIYADAHKQAMRTMPNGLFVNCGSVGNGIGIPKCCYAILCGEEGDNNAPFEIRMRQLDYDRDQAIQNSLAAPEVPMINTFIREIETGIYSRR